MNQEVFSAACRRQYGALFQMLSEALERCPEELWDRRSDEAPFWRQALHTLLALDFYFQEEPDGLRNGLLLALAGKKREVLMEDPEAYSRFFATWMRRSMDLDWEPAMVAPKVMLQVYLEEVAGRCFEALERDRRGLFQPGNAFEWTGPTLADKHLYNLRHAQHHVGRLSSLLSRDRGKGIPWVMAAEA